MRLSPDSAAFLVSSRPGFMGGLIRHTSEDLIPKWLHLNDVVANGGPTAAVNQQTAGVEFFEQFVNDIFPMSYPAAQDLAQYLRLDLMSDPVKVLDLAAGSGVWGIALAQSAPQVQVCAVDWPGVIPGDPQECGEVRIRGSVLRSARAICRKRISAPATTWQRSDTFCTARARRAAARC